MKQCKGHLSHSCLCASTHLNHALRCSLSDYSVLQCVAVYAVGKTWAVYAGRKLLRQRTR